MMNPNVRQSILLIDDEEGFRDPEVRQGMNLWADDYLIKPANILDLLGAIKARLARRQSERQKQEQQMERAMRLFGETVHDLRNPLCAVFGYTNRLKNAAANPDRSQERADQSFAGLQRAPAMVWGCAWPRVASKSMAAASVSSASPVKARPF